jgi:hypothetical protein
LRHVDAKILGGVEEQATKEIEKKWQRQKGTQENEMPWNPTEKNISSLDIIKHQYKDTCSVVFNWL